MMIRRGDRKYREFECSECEIKRHIYEIERENLCSADHQTYITVVTLTHVTTVINFCLKFS